MSLRISRPSIRIRAAGVPVRALLFALMKVYGIGPDCTLLEAYERARAWS